MGKKLSEPMDVRSFLYAVWRVTKASERESCRLWSLHSSVRRGLSLSHRPVFYPADPEGEIELLLQQQQHFSFLCVCSRGVIYTPKDMIEMLYDLGHQSRSKQDFFKKHYTTQNPTSSTCPVNTKNTRTWPDLCFYSTRSPPTQRNVCSLWKKEDPGQ